MSIQWYPGHVARARQEILRHLKAVDAVVEVRDARIPAASKNPDADRLLSGIARLVALNKADLADRALTEAWLARLKAEGLPAVATDAQKGSGVRELLAAVENLVEDRLAAWMSKGRQRRPLRLMVVGVPNVGKSSLINRLAGRSGAKTGDKPGVTRGPQWLKVGRDLELLDMPGILWPKIGDPEVGFRLAATGAIEARLFSAEAVALRLVEWLETVRPGTLAARYGVELAATATPEETLEEVGRRRGCLVAGGRVDLERAAATLLSDFRAGRLGGYTLDEPPSEEPE
ncbi:MAG: ribosome biogenesis GTPase YlqF [Chitinophagales bacterium]